MNSKKKRKDMFYMIMDNSHMSYSEARSYQHTLDRQGRYFVKVNNT